MTKDNKQLEQSDFNRIKKYQGKKKGGRVMSTYDVAESVGWSAETVRLIFKYKTWPAYRQGMKARAKARKEAKEAKVAEAKQAEMRSNLRAKRRPAAKPVTKKPEFVKKSEERREKVAEMKATPASEKPMPPEATLAPSKPKEEESIFDRDVRLLEEAAEKKLKVHAVREAREKNYIVWIVAIVVVFAVILLFVI